MDFLTSKIRPMYFKYLAAAFGSALISSIYGVVDMAMVGWYQGPDGTAALAVVSPVWNIIYSLGLLMGIGGSVLFSTLRGESGKNLRKSNEYFMAVLFGVGSLALITNTLRLEKPEKMFFMLRRICVTGISTFFIDVAMGILTMLFNRQILKYLGTDALSVYGIIINISTFVQCCAYSIGQASQPMISTSYGAGKGERISQILKYVIGTAVVFGVIWSALAIFVPNLFVRVFMTPTEEILAIAPKIIRSYGISFILLPFNIFSTYYFQALLKPTASFIVSVSRGALVSGMFIYLLPAVAGADAIWFSMPFTELIVAVFVAIKMKQYTKQLVE